MTTRDVGRLLGAAELARVLGVSRQRVTQLAAKAAFPPPVAVLTMGSVWTLGDVQSWADDHGRRLDLDALQTPTGPGKGARSETSPAADETVNGNRGRLP